MCRNPLARLLRSCLGISLLYRSLRKIMADVSALQASVDKVVADIDLAVTDKAALKASNDVLTKEVVDLQAQLAAFAGDAQAMADMKAKLDAIDAKLVA